MHPICFGTIACLVKHSMCADAHGGTQARLQRVILNSVAALQARYRPVDVLSRPRARASAERLQRHPPAASPGLSERGMIMGDTYSQPPDERLELSNKWFLRVPRSHQR